MTDSELNEFLSAAQETNEMTTDPLPLAGICVVAVEQAVAAPFATRQLADLGARVIKIERPNGGDFARQYDDVVNGVSSVFAWLNRSKESLALDLKHPSAGAVLDRLLERADVLVQNLAPGASSRLGLDPLTLRDRYPHLVVCGISGFGDSGPYRDRKAYDLLIQAETGLFDVTGTLEEPCRVGISVADIAGGMYAFSGILAALIRRSRTGQGATIDVSLFEALSEWVSHALYFTMYGGAVPPRTGAQHGLIVPYGIFETLDGQRLVIAVQNEDEWFRFCADVLESPRVGTDERFRGNSRRVSLRTEVEGLVSAAVHELTYAQLVERLDRASIAYADVSSLADLPDHSQHRERSRWREVNTPEGPMRALLPPFNLDETEARMDEVPALGQHTDEILQWLGYSTEDLDQLTSAGAAIQA